MIAADDIPAEFFISSSSFYDKSKSSLFYITTSPEMYYEIYCYKVSSTVESSSINYSKTRSESVIFEKAITLV